jgi:hypothetical protein
MSTQPFVRRRGRPMDRGPELRRLLSIAVAFALVFAVAFLLGHTGSGANVAEHLPPGLPRVATPVASRLPAAPAIELAVAQPPPPPAPAVSPSRLAAPTVTTTPSIITPTPVSPSPQPTAASPTPAVVTPPAQAAPPSKPSGSSTPSHETAGSGAGRSFESSE